MSDAQHGVAGLRVIAYPGYTRTLAATLYFFSRASLFLVALAIAVGFVFSPPLLVRLVFFGGAVPALMLLVMMRLFMGVLEPQGQAWILRRHRWYRRGDGLNLDKVHAGEVRPWRWPWPGPGFSIRLTNDIPDRWLHVQFERPATIIQPLVGGAAGGEPLHAYAGMVYADARARLGRARWYHLFFKYGLFPLVPAFIVFRLHQNIMYGGLLAQYHLEGLAPYLSALAYHWIMVLVYLLLWASLLRGLAAGACMFSASLFPAMAEGVRRWSENGVRLLYYGGVVALILWRSVA